jgi:hypothetical protein
MSKLANLFSQLAGLRKSLESPFEINRGDIRGNYYIERFYPNDAKEYFSRYNNLLNQLKEECPELYGSFSERKINNLPSKDWIPYENLAILKMELDNIFEIKATKEVLSQNPINKIELAELQLDRVFRQFHKIAQGLRDRHGNRNTIIIKDEYDVQDLLEGILRLYFDDIRPEEFSPSNSGSNSRIDFILKNEEIGIEVKMTNKNLKDKQLGEQILIDIGKYREHPNCSTLFVFIYDKDDFIKNKQGLKRDLEANSSIDFPIKIYISPN